MAKITTRSHRRLARFSSVKRKLREGRRARWVTRPRAPNAGQHSSPSPSVYLRRYRSF
jgi:hypothetical protein